MARWKVENVAEIMSPLMPAVCCASAGGGALRSRPCRGEIVARRRPPRQLIPATDQRKPGAATTLPSARLHTPKFRNHGWCKFRSGSDLLPRGARLCLRDQLTAKIATRGDDQPGEEREIQAQRCGKLLIISFQQDGISLNFTLTGRVKPVDAMHQRNQ